MHLSQNFGLAARSRVRMGLGDEGFGDVCSVSHQHTSISFIFVNGIRVPCFVVLSC